jgi:peptidoglycan/LPS O-acetylase OafA/YrhL
LLLIFFIFNPAFHRLTPVYALVIAFYATLLPHLGSGPRWNLVVTPVARACAENWPNNLLYINNFYKSDNIVSEYLFPCWRLKLEKYFSNQCMNQTWYLAADMQLYLLSPLLVYILWKNPAVGKICLFCSAAVPAAYTAFYIYTNKAIPTLVFNNS